MANWNPWHGCHKKSEGCAHCYVYRGDAKYGRDASEVVKTADFDLPVRRLRDGRYKLAGGQLVWTCFSSDFLVEDADVWREQALEMIRERQDLRFLFITKRPERFSLVMPQDWERSFSNVTMCVTVENQRRADERLPIYLQLPLKKRIICCEPLLEKIDIRRYLGPWISNVVAGGESGPGARVCDYDWVLSLRAQCDDAGCGFHFKQTGANFLKNGRHYSVPRRLQHSQAAKAGIDTAPLMGG